jgi:purine-cytosine permease-like protein
MSECFGEHGHVFLFFFTAGWVVGWIVFMSILACRGRP